MSPRVWTVLTGGALAVAVAAAWLGVRFVTSPPPVLPEPAVATPTPIRRASAPAREPVLLPGRSVPLTVLMYHHIGPAPANARGWVHDLYVPAERFERDLARLQEHRCCVMTMAQAVRFIAEDRLPRNAVVLTFDDGYEDNASIAAPLLQRHGLVGTFNVVVSKIGDGKHMSREQLRKLAAAGHEIGCHSLTHPDLRRVDDARLQRETADARRDLETLLGRPVVTYCYPDGKYDDRALRAVAGADYRVALATGLPTGRFDTARPFEVGRYRVTPRKDIPAALLQHRSEETARE